MKTDKIDHKNSTRNPSNQKYLIILSDGMADEPIAALGNKTPLQYAHTPHIDKLAQMGQCGMLDTIPDGFHPGSEIANLSVLGYDVAEVFEGRGTLEAASMGIEIAEDEMAMRCNLICVENGRIKNHSAGHISNAEAEALILFLQQTLGNDIINFYPGISYRHLLKMKGGNKQLKCTPPHDVPGQSFADKMITPLTKDARPTAQLLNDLILKSQQLLENHPVNIERARQGKDKANSIWPWSPGYKPQMRRMTDIFPIKSGAVISAVDLIKGIGVYAGLRNIEVEGATGLYNTNYEGKIEAAIAALSTDDFVYLHIEACDEAGHEGDVDLKVKTIEYLDYRVIKTVLEHLPLLGESVTIALLPDHPTPCSLRTHTNTPVPFIIYSTKKEADDVSKYDEESCKKGNYGLLKGKAFIETFFG